MPIEDHLKAVIGATKKVSSDKYAFSTRVFDDGDIQITVAPTDAGSSTYVSATGTAKTLEEALVKLRANLAVRIQELITKGHVELDEHHRRASTRHEVLTKALLLAAPYEV